MTDTNKSLDTRLDEILWPLTPAKPTPVISGEAGAFNLDVRPDPINEAKTALKKLIDEARLQELLNIPFNDGRFNQKWIEEHWAERIRILQSENKDTE